MRHTIASVVCVLGLMGGSALLPGCASNRVTQPSGDRDADTRLALELARKAEEAQRDGDDKQAVSYAQQALILRNDLGGVWNNLGVSLMHLEQWIPAVDALRRAADLLPTDPRPYENLGYLYRERGFGEDALRNYAQSLERDPYWLPSIRGAVASAKDLLRSDDDGLERVKRGLLVDNDPKWRKVYEAERVRIKQDLDEKVRRLKSGL